MSVLTAQQQLETMVDAATEPTLSADEISTLLGLCAVADSSGLPPTDASWTPTYELNRGAAEGWRWKAAKVATQFDFSSEERSKYNRSQVHEMCLVQAHEYRKKIAAAVSFGSPIASSSLDPVTP